MCGRTVSSLSAPAGSAASYFERSFSVKSVVLAFAVNVARTTPEIALPRSTAAGT